MSDPYSTGQVEEEDIPNSKLVYAQQFLDHLARLLIKMRNGGIGTDAATEVILHKTLKLRQQLNSGSGLVHPEARADLVRKAFDNICSGIDTGRISTGMVCLDNVLLGGLAKGTVTVLAGATGSGKSVALQQVAEYAASCEKRVLFIAVEMDTIQLSFRSIARMTGLEASRIRRGRLNEGEKWLVRQAIAELGKLSIHYKDAGNMSTAGIYEAVLETQKEYGSVDLIVVDYMQILQDEQGGGNENIRLTGISRALASIAREFQCPVLVGSQLSRESVKRHRRPTPQDLRESGSIENDATTVILLHSNYDPDSGVDQEDIELITWIVGKNRNGIQNVDVMANFYKPQQKFLELPPKQQGIAGEGVLVVPVGSNGHGTLERDLQVVRALE